MKIDVMVGMDLEGEGFYPVLAGAISHDVLEVIPAEDEDRMWREMKEKFTMDPDAYLWRQIEVVLDDTALQTHFRGEVVFGKVAPAEES